MSDNNLNRTNLAPDVSPAAGEGPSGLSERERLHHVLQNAFDLIAETGLDGQYRYVSPNYETALGWTAQEMVGKFAREFLHPDDVDRLRAEWPHHLAGKLDRVDYRFRHKSGGWRWFEGIATLVDTGNGQQSSVFVSHDITERKRHEAELAALIALGKAVNSHAEVRQQINLIAAHLQPFLPFDDLFISVLEDGELRLFTGVFRTGSFGGLTHAELAGSSQWAALQNGNVVVDNDFHLPPDANRVVRSYITVPLRVEGQSIGFLHLDSHLPHTWTEDHIRLAGLVGEQVASTVWQANLLEQARRQEAMLAESNALLRATQEAAADGICLVDDSGQVVSYNRRFAQLWNIAPVNEDDLRRNGQIMSYVLQQLDDPDEFIDRINFLYERPEALARDEILLKDGRYFERYSATATAFDADGNPTRSFGRIWSFIDISDRKRYEAQLSHQAFHDAVTGLPNRLLFIDRLTRALAKTERSHRLVAVLFLDLDRFKVVNDSLGHEKGDLLLIEAARRLLHSLRPGDSAARFGGDEFVVLLEDVATQQDAIRVAERIAHNLHAPFTLDGHEVQITASIGIVLSDGAESVADDLLRKADVAMYRAKNRGRAQYEIFTEELSEQALERLSLELELAGVIKRGELRLHYQPLVDLETGTIGAFEALVRWEHPERGIIHPAMFIPVAEETGLIMPIGLWVLEEACRQAQIWTQDHRIEILMHVNLSVRQFEQTNLLGDVARILERTGLAAQQLVLEITESAVMTDARAATEQLRQLKELGVRVSIDDFGTGYSSLSYLEFFPIDSLKIDRSFVARLGEGTAVVRAVAMLGQAMNVEVAAEGVETVEQLEQLRALHCRWGQGYLFSRPVVAKEAEKLLRKKF